MAQLITINVDGSPQVSGVWVGLDGDELVIASLPKRIKVRNVERDPRVALVVQSPTKSVRGLDEYLVVHGTARITEGGAPELVQRLARVYLGPDAVFPGTDAGAAAARSQRYPRRAPPHTSATGALATRSSPRRPRMYRA